MIKHLFSDLDGTLLNNNGELSDYTKKIIGECNIPLTLVSARSPQKMESILNEMNGMLEDVNDAFEKWKSLRPKIKKLLKYYESPAWFRYVDASNSWEIPENISHWVLSEDAAWNAFVFEYWLAKEFQKLTKQVLKR